MYSLVTANQQKGCGFLPIQSYPQKMELVFGSLKEFGKVVTELYSGQIDSWMVMMLLRVLVPSSC
jgi:hypothetical protein